MSMINGTSSSSSHIIVRPEHIMNCEFSHWFPIYKDVSFKSHIIELPNQFLLWLKADGVSLPPDTPTSIFCATNDDSDSDDNDGDDISQTSSSTSTFQFDELNRQVQEAIESLGGHAFPKTNWSAPQDAAWMNMGSLKCSQVGDVYLLLKSSDFVSHDLYYPFEMCTQPEQLPPSQPEQEHFVENTTTPILSLPTVNYTLILRKWQNLRPERSFRCFIKNHSLVALSQRDCTAFFPQLLVEIDKITSSISDFFKSTGRGSKNYDTATNIDSNNSSVISNRFPDPHFVVDVYIDQSHKIWIVDVNAWAPSTDSLMFDWNEYPLTSNQLQQEKKQDHSKIDTKLPPPPGSSASASAAEEEGLSVAMVEPEVRIVNKEACIRPGNFSEYKAPLEMHQFSQTLNGDMGSQHQGSAEGLAEFIAFMAQCEKKNKS